MSSHRLTCDSDSRDCEEELRDIIDGLGGQRAVARLMGCSQPAIAQYFAGRKMKQEIADQLRALHQASVRTP